MANFNDPQFLYNLMLGQNAPMVPSPGGLSNIGSRPSDMQPYQGIPAESPPIETPFGFDRAMARKTPPYPVQPVEGGLKSLQELNQLIAGVAATEQVENNSLVKKIDTNRFIPSNTKANFKQKLFDTYAYEDKKTLDASDQQILSPPSGSLETNTIASELGDEYIVGGASADDISTIPGPVTKELLPPVHESLATDPEPYDTEKGMLQLLDMEQARTAPEVINTSGQEFLSSPRGYLSNLNLSKTVPIQELISPAETTEPILSVPIGAQVIGPPTAGTAPPAASTIGDPVINKLDNEIKKSLKTLDTTPDPESTKPFFNWLHDFSEGLRAGKKRGLGGIADAFANVRNRQKERDATQLKTRKITIENIKNLGEIREDIITADRLGAPGSSAQALYGAYVGPGEVLGANGTIPRAYMEKLGYPWWVRGTYSTTKSGRIMQEFHKTDPTKDKKVRFYPIDPKTKLAVYEDSVLVSPSDSNFPKYSRSDNYTQTGPSETSTALTANEITEMFKGNTTYLKRLQDTGASVRVTKNADGTIKSYEIHNAQKQSVKGFFDPKTGSIVVGDPNNPRHRKEIFKRNLVPVTFEMDTVGKSSSVQLANEINSARQGVEIINKLKELRDAGRGKAILGSIATAKKAGGNFADILKQAGNEFLPFYSFGQQLQYDIDNNLVDKNVQSWLDKDLATANILQTSLIYKYAKILKGTGRLNSDDIRRAEDALGQRGFLNSDVDIFARYEAVLPLFNETITAKTALLKKARLAETSLESPLFTEPTTLENLSVSEEAKTLARDLKDNEKFAKNPNATQINRLLNNPTAEEKKLFNDVFGLGTAEIVLKRNK